MMHYVAIDVETANSDFSSICQIGIAEFKDGKIINSWSSLIDPQEPFDFINVEIHGIDEKMVEGAPTFQDLYDQIYSWINDKVTVHHMPFDKVAITRACEKYELPNINPTWLDSAKVARRTWAEVAYKGYGLSNLSKFLNFTFDHHDALEDAIAAGKIVLEASRVTNMNIEGWIERATKPLTTPASIKLDGNQDGPLFGENIVFTGSLQLTRSEAAKIAANLGCNVTNSVTKKTTMLVIGFQDVDKLAGYKKSSKQRKAEDLSKNGSEIKFLSEKDFVKILDMDV